ncbi:alpha-mannosidase [Paenibacillus protaetiae]|uniref:Alpha-mannosidase n=1 Tax=Paenibacillus protaetiae TaxID=2509456 RepID=A0A4P6F4E3_9BACL|nr:glycoside hydrolase family 38 C-terminal domain-containing protein [Paenibacillus protaetiae]QAY65258.1 alpha-mannosidase [Paenibacillus protaetiae]
MPYEANTIKLDKVKAVLSRLRGAIYEPVGELTVHAWVTKEPVSFADRMNGRPLGSLRAGDKWAELWECAWFHFEGKVPATAAGKKVVLLLDIHGEICVVDGQGVPCRGLTTKNSTFDYTLGMPGKRVVEVTGCADGGEIIDLWADGACNDLFGNFQGGTIKEANIAVCDESCRRLYYDWEVLSELAEQLPDTGARKAQVMQTLYEASLVLADLNPESVSKASVMLQRELARKGGDPVLEVSAVGHAHIDLAWLWPIRETVRKGARTFATALRNMENYPDYVFGASQPQLYQWIKERYPELYGQIKERVQEGRWEAQGAMWVEPDTNISGGEALIRQILYGKRFFQEEFGKEMKVLWLPDVFGYSGSLPQLLKKSGVDYMMTQKLSWSVYNTHPHHSFFWEGIDGTRVLTHLPPEDTYNSPASPRSLVKIENQYLDRNVSSHALMLFGIGDGGGGPGEEHLERLEREKNLSGLPPVVQESSIAFFRKLEREAGRFKTFKGELYLEKHQGTLTTQGRNKWYNRKMEKGLRELEYVSSLLWELDNVPYPAEKLEQIWKEVLLYQFHDILPGSSIARVYDESLQRYSALYEEVTAMTKDAYERLAGLMGWAGETAVFNSLSWEREEWIKQDEDWYRVVVPAMGSVSLREAVRPLPAEGLSASERQLENDRLLLRFNEDGHLVSMYDKILEREAVYPGEAANVFSIYYDDGDAWDFPHDYRERLAGTMKLADCKFYMEGPHAVLEQTFQFGESSLSQKVMLSAGENMVRFETVADWKESGKMLRAAFPVNVFADEAYCDIQFGFIKRPTTRNTGLEFAKDEICSHHYIDLSQHDYGVALLNDSKYGHSVQGHVIDLNLLRSPHYPDPEADRALHSFTYALFPHKGNPIDAGVSRKGYELNVPLTVVKGRADENRRHRPVQLITVDHPLVILETVKKAEDSDRLLFRLYETGGTYARTKLTFGLPCAFIEETNLMEEPLQRLQPQASEVEVAFTPFEIKTFSVAFAK